VVYGRVDMPPRCHPVPGRCTSSARELVEKDFICEIQTKLLGCSGRTERDCLCGFSHATKIVDTALRIPSPFGIPGKTASVASQLPAHLEQNNFAWRNFGCSPRITPVFFHLFSQVQRMESSLPLATLVWGSITKPHWSQTALMVYSMAIYWRCYGYSATPTGEERLGPFWK